MNSRTPEVIDMHVHVGLLGNEWPQWGGMSEWYRRQLVYKIFLFWAAVPEAKVSDRVLREATLRTIATSGIDKVVCLALDPVYNTSGQRLPDKSNVWADNEYVLEVQKDLPDRILLGASVHPYDPLFEERVRHYVSKGAILLKWLPSAQQIDLADDRVGRAMKFLATAKNGKPLPLLLHCGVEYAIPSTDSKTHSYDFLSWSFWDGAQNVLRGKGKWHKPDVAKIRRNLDTALDAGTVIIFAHCGTPYFASRIVDRFFEHSDFDVVQDYLGKYKNAYADVSAFCTPFRVKYFSDVKKLPESQILFGSDFPTPVFELYADVAENLRDFEAMLNGHLERIVVPQDNLLDVNYRELQRAFPGHAMFTNFNSIT